MGKTRDAGVGDKRDPGFDPTEIARLYADIAEKSSALITQFVANHAEGAVRPISDELGISKAFFEAWSRIFSDPVRLAEAQVRLWQDYWSLWQSSMWKLWGHAAAPIAEAATGDRRFRHQDWQSNFL